MTALDAISRLEGDLRVAQGDARAALAKAKRRLGDVIEYDSAYPGDFRIAADVTITVDKETFAACLRVAIDVSEEVVDLDGSRPRHLYLESGLGLFCRDTGQISHAASLEISPKAET